MLSKTDIQKLQDLPIEQVAEALQMAVSRHKALCPFHADTRPSLTFNTRINHFRCYVCNASGGSIDLVMKSQRWNFYEACKWLANRFGVIISEDLSAFEARKLATRYIPHAKQPVLPPPLDVRHLEQLIREPYLNEEACQFLYNERKILPQVVKQMGLSSISQPTPMSGNPYSGWYNAPSLLIPYRDIEGKLLSVQARYLGEKVQEADKPRFQFPKGSRCSIFNLPILKTLTEGEALWITEGVSDCLAMMSSGRKSIAIPSATLLKADDVQRLQSLSSSLSLTFHMAPDNDAPGAKLYLELKKLLPQLQHHLLPEPYKDFGDYWKNVKC